MADNVNRRTFIKTGSTLAGAVALSGLGATARAGLTIPEYIDCDATDLAKLVARKKVTASELLETAIQLTERYNPQLNAVVIDHFEMARAQVAAGLPKGPLQGVPWLLKDLHLSLKGTVTTNGSLLFKNAVADFTSTLVERYQQAGLVIFGKSASPEFGGTATTESKIFGETHNPWALDYSPGGSSGGSAAAVAAGILPAANASDGGGSIRIPASNCGLFGLKPTRARVPMGPHRFEGPGGASVLHAVTRSVRDSALLLDISRGMAPYEPYTAPPVIDAYLNEIKRKPGKLRIGVVTGTFTRTPVHSECVKGAIEAAELCASLGHHVEELGPLPLDPRRYFGAMTIISAASTAATIRKREREIGRKATPEDVEVNTWSKMEDAEKFSATDLHNARNEYFRVGAILAGVMEKYDIILSPTQAAPPPKLGVMSMSNPDQEEFTAAAIAASIFTSPYNVSGMPAMSVPLHWTPEGLPVGVQFAARFGDEATLFRLAAQLEKAKPWMGKRPPGF